ncbi:MAG: aldo/keto reductase [Cyclobacteriaceae bacterium]|nr:aldo/keto reductase [Cyclobacteriaceae bacterium]
MNRREYLGSMAALGIISATPSLAIVQSQSIMKRIIPSTGEKLPVVGVGTWQTFDVDESDRERIPLKTVLQQLIKQDGSVIDSSPMYGRSERVVGDLSTELGINNKLFMATKVWTSGREAGIRQMNTSMSLMKRDKMDLMQIHNLVDWQTHYKTLRQWKDEGKIRYIGITHYVDSAHDQVERIIKNNPIDFIQINYSIVNRHAETGVLNTAQERGVATIINQPFGGGGLFGKVRGKDVPQWAKEFGCESWGCFFLKYLLANPAVTCVIPGTSKLQHMIDNLSAGVGGLPSDQQRQQMIALIDG